MSQAPDIRPRLLDLRKAASYLGRSVYSLRELIWRGELPYISTGKGGKVFIDIRDLDSWIESNKRIEGRG